MFARNSTTKSRRNTKTGRKDVRATAVRDVGHQGRRGHETVLSLSHLWQGAGHVMAAALQTTQYYVV